MARTYQEKQRVTKTGKTSAINQQHKKSQMPEFSSVKDDQGGYAHCSMFYRSIIPLWCRKRHRQSGTFNVTQVIGTHTQMVCEPLVGWTKHFLAFLENATSRHHFPVSIKTANLIPDASLFMTVGML